MKKFLISIAIISAAIITAWKVNYPSGSWRYKITVEVETPEGIKSGSAVREVHMGFEPKILGVSGVLLGEIGEAVAIDLGQRGVVFALMSDQSWENGLYQAFPTQDAYSRRGFEYYRKTLKTGMQAEWRENQPIFVTFNDLNDPLSVKSVRIGNLEQEFGEGIRFKRISVEITDEPVTRDIEKWLPWLPNRKKGSLDGQLGKFSNDLSNALHYGNFKKGFKQ